MKKSHVLFLTGAALTGLVNVSHAATTIIDASTLNGSFETGTGDGEGSTITNWGVGLNVDQLQRIGNNATNGTYSAVMGSVQGSTPGDPADTQFGLLQNTGYNVASGDTFDLAFDWAAALRWDTADTIDYRLFTTSDDTLSGTLSEIVSGSVTGDSGTPPSYEPRVSLTDIGTVVGANVGQDLWIEFYSSSASVAGNGDGEFARLDNVALGYNAVPEPSAFALLSGLLAFTSIMHRRRRT